MDFRSQQQNLNKNIQANGFILLEILISVLIFSIGVLTLARGQLFACQQVELAYAYTEKTNEVNSSSEQALARQSIVNGNSSSIKLNEYYNQ